ncbi:MAG TPA: hypothetical protein VK850_20660 [Candidatus Binatia bacterium]|jgi:hypothetical protein|nr:hypothetical protein [Candidatus Binatia bacterium]
MSWHHKLLADLIFFGMACGIYLQYRSVKAIGQVPSRSERGYRLLNRTEALKIVEGLAYAGLGVVFETLSVTKAAFF